MAFQLKAILNAQDNTAGAFNSVQGRMDGMAAGARNLAGLIGVSLSAAAFVSFIRGSIDAAEKLDKLSIQTGIAVTDLAGLQHAANLSGTDLDGVATSVKKLSTYMFDAQSGTKANADMLKMLGVTAKEPLPALMQLADQFAKMPDGAEKSAVAVKVLGKAGADMIPMLNQGGAALRDMIDEGKNLSGMTDEFAANAVIFNDNLDRMKLAAHGAGISLAADMMPAMNNIMQAMIDATKEGGLFLGVMVGINEFRIELFKSSDADRVVEINTQIKNLRTSMDGISEWTWGGERQYAHQKDKIGELQKELTLLTAGIDAADMLAKPDKPGYVKPKFTPGIAGALGGDDAGKALQKQQDALTAMGIKFDNEEYARAIADHARRGQLDIDAGMAKQGGVFDQYAIELQAEQAHDSALMAEYKAHADATDAINKASASAKLAIMQSSLGTIAGLMGSKNKELFAIGKAAAIAGAIISTHKGAADALAYGGPLGYILAAGVLAAGAVQINAIRKTQIGSGTSPSGGVAAPTANPGISGLAFADAPSVAGQPRFQNNDTIFRDRLAQKPTVNNVEITVNAPNADAATVQQLIAVLPNLIINTVNSTLYSHGKAAL